MLEQCTAFRLPHSLLNRSVRVLLVGAGGNGSQMLPGLARLHMTLVALGHPAGLHVTTVDGDTVSMSNVGRQLFYRTDIGLSKAVVLTHRVNACFGLSWSSYFGFVDESTSLNDVDLVISCVDTRKARRTIHKLVEKSQGRQLLWLDLGNEAYTGQCILGQSGGAVRGRDEWKRPPTVTEFFPTILDAKADAAAERDEGPSCSLAAAIEKQSAFVNQMCATHALTLLSNLFRFGETSYSAIFFDTKSGRSSPLAVDPAAWSRFGIERPPAPVLESSVAGPAVQSL